MEGVFDTNISRPKYSELLDLVSSGRLSIVFILGLARGGTTAVEKHLYASLSFDANVNEPTLSGPEACWDDNANAMDSAKAKAAGQERAALGFAGVIAWEEACFEEVLCVVRPLIKARTLNAAETLGMTAKRWPVRVIVKEVTNKVLPSTVPFWASLSHAVVVVIRQPLLQLESRLKSVLDRVGSGALVPFGLHDSMPLDSCQVHGHPLVLPSDLQQPATGHCGAATSEEVCKEKEGGGANEKDESTWGSMWREMKSTRNFRALGPGLSRAACLHPFCAKPEVQRAVWQHAANRVAEASNRACNGGNEENKGNDGTTNHHSDGGSHSGESDSDGSFPLFEHLLGLPLNSFHEMDAPLVEAIWDWRLGWTPLLAQLPALDKHPRCLIVDFSAFQTSPQPTEEALSQCLEPFWHPEQAHVDASDLAPHEAPAKETPESMHAPGGKEAEPAGAGEFTVCSGSAVNYADSASKLNKAAKWSAWYDPCFARVAASSRIEAVDKAPINAAALPPCLLADQSAATNDRTLPPLVLEQSLKGDTYLSKRRQALLTTSLLRRAFGLYVDLLLDPRTVMGEGIVPSMLRTGTAHENDRTKDTSTSARSKVSAKSSNSSARSRARAVASEIDPLHGALWRRAVSIAHERAKTSQGQQESTSPATTVDSVAGGIASMDAIVEDLVFTPLCFNETDATPSAARHSTSNYEVLFRSSSTLQQQQPFLSVTSLTAIIWDVFDLTALATLLVLNLTFAAASHLYLRACNPRRFDTGGGVNDLIRPSETGMVTPPKARFTVVIPAFNEAASISRALASVTRGHQQARDDGNASRGAAMAIDVVVVDGGSTDGTEATVKAFVALHPETFRMALPEENRSHAPVVSADGHADDAQRVVTVHLTRSTGGRGPALAHGVALTEDTSLSRPSYPSEAKPCALDLEAVVVLHADSELPDQWARSAMQLLANPRVSMVAFPFRLQRNQLPTNSDAVGLRNLVQRCSVALLEKSVELRSARFELPFGDQGLAIRRSTLKAIGGVPLLPLMEDYELAMRVRKIGRIITVPYNTSTAVTQPPATISPNSSGSTSARRFEARGALWRQCLANQIALVSFATGLATPEQIGRWY